MTFCDLTIIQWLPLSDLTLYRTRPFTEFWEVSIEHLRRVWHTDRGRLLIRTPGPVSLGLAYVLLVDTNPFSGLCSSNIPRYFLEFTLNRWSEYNEIWQEARSYSILPSLCFSGKSEKQDDRPGLWLAETFSISPLKPLIGIQRNLTGSKIIQSSTKFVFFGQIGKTRWPPRPLIDWDIFDFSSETADRNTTKFDRKQDQSVLYQVCVFRANRKNKMAAPASNLLRHFLLLLWNRRTEYTKLGRKQDLNVLYQVCVFRADWKNKMAARVCDLLSYFRLLLSNRWTEFKETWPEARSQCPLQSLCFSCWSEKIDGCPASDGLRHFRCFLWNRWTEFNKNWEEARSQCLLSSVCFSGRLENKIAAPASDWLIHFRLLLSHHLTEFNETWQEARSQRPLQNLCFLGRSENKIAALANPSKKWLVVLRCTICGPLAPLFLFRIFWIIWNFFKINNVILAGVFIYLDVTIDSIRGIYLKYGEKLTSK